MLRIHAKPANGGQVLTGFDTYVTKDGTELRSHVQGVALEMSADGITKATLRVLPSEIDISIGDHQVTVLCSACGMPHDCTAFLPEPETEEF